MTPELAGRIRRADRLSLGGEVVLAPGEEVLGPSLRDAVRRAWVGDGSEDGDRRRGREEEH